MKRHISITVMFADWLAGRAYIDGRGNYHVRRPGHSLGPVAAWNRDAKIMFQDSVALHRAAHRWQAAGPHA